jgi:hypothetical protein
MGTEKARVIFGDGDRLEDRNTMRRESGVQVTTSASLPESAAAKVSRRSFPPPKAGNR